MLDERRDSEDCNVDSREERREMRTSLLLLLVAFFTKWMPLDRANTTTATATDTDATEDTATTAIVSLIFIVSERGG